MHLWLFVYEDKTIAAEPGPAWRLSQLSDQEAAVYLCLKGMSNYFNVR